MEARESIEQRPGAAHERSLEDWTSSDDAMRWAGERLGVFGDGRIPADAVLAHDNRLRRALFDVLLNLVEGGVADIRGSETGYEFRARADDEVAWLAPAGPTIDLTAPAPLSEELKQACLERDEALRRAAVAEALAAERERILMRFAAATEIHVVRHEDESGAGSAALGQPTSAPIDETPRDEAAGSPIDEAPRDEAAASRIDEAPRDEVASAPVDEVDEPPIVDQADVAPVDEQAAAASAAELTGAAPSTALATPEPEIDKRPETDLRTETESATSEVASTAPLAEPAVAVAPEVDATGSRRRWPWIVAAIVLFAIAVLAAIVGAVYIARSSGPLFLPHATTDARQNAAAAVSFAIGFVALVLMGLALWTVTRRRARSSIASS